MKGHASKLLTNFNIPTIRDDLINKRIVTLKNVRMLKVSTTSDRGIPGDFKCSKVKPLDKEFVKYVPLTTQAYWESIRHSISNPGTRSNPNYPIEIEEVKIDIRLPAYAAKLFRSNTDDGENVVLKAMSAQYFTHIEETGEDILLWEGVAAMFPDEPIDPDEKSVEAEEFTSYMDELLGFGKHADLTWAEVDIDYLKRNQHVFTDTAKYKAQLEIKRREAMEPEPANVVKAGSYSTDLSESPTEPAEVTG